MSERTPRSVTVVGLGVMGGSVAKAVLRRAPGVPVFGIEPDRHSAEMAARDGVRVLPRLDDCDLDGGVVVFATPLDVAAKLVRETASAWRRAALVTDVASLKAAILDAARASQPSASAQSGGAAFVGAHPMCGSERSGYVAARADLFEGADVWLCPLGAGGSAAAAFWTMLGARTRTVSAEHHDRIMALASHLPQLLANALAATLDEAGVGRDLLGPGGRGMTRLAGSSSAMWMPLLDAAADEDAAALGAVERQIGHIRRMLESGDLAGLDALMARGRKWMSAKA